MTKFNPGGRVTRRGILAGSVGLAAMGLVSPLIGGNVLGVGQSPAPRTWLGQVDGDLTPGTKVRPFGSAVSTLRTDQPLLLRVRGPWSLSADAPLPEMTLSMIYRSCPQHPYLLWKHTASAGPVSSQLHAHAAALAAIEVQCNDRSSQCALTGLFNPALGVGLYVLVIDPTGRHAGPDWAALDIDSDSGQVISRVDGPALAALLLDVSAA